MTSFTSEMGAIKDMLVLLGKKTKTLEIHREYNKRKIFGPWGLKQLANLYQDNALNKLKELALYYYQKNVLDKIKEFVSDLKNQGILVGALSSDPQFLMDILKEKNCLDFAYGTELEFERGIATGNIFRKLDRYGKAKILEEKKKELNVSNVITIARASITHLPVLRKSNIFIGFNPKEEPKILRAILDNKNFIG